MSANLKIVSMLAILLITACGRYWGITEKLDLLEFETFDCDALRVEGGESFLCRTPDGEIEKIRLIGIRIPKEKESEAKKLSESILRRGTLVKVEPEEGIGYEHGYIPAYVFVPGGKMLNILLIQKGYAFSVTEAVGDKHKNAFMEAQSEGKGNKPEVNGNGKD